MAQNYRNHRDQHCCQRCNYNYCLAFGLALMLVSVGLICISTIHHGYDALLYSGSVVLFVACVFTWCGAGVVAFQYKLLQNRFKCCRYCLYFCYGCCLDDKDKEQCKKDFPWCYQCCQKCSHDEPRTRHSTNRSNRRGRSDAGDGADSRLHSEDDAIDMENGDAGDRGQQDMYLYSDGTYGPRRSQRTSGLRGLDDDMILAAILDRQPLPGGELRPQPSLHSVLSLPPAYEEPDPNPPPYTNAPPPAYEDPENPTSSYI